MTVRHYTELTYRDNKARLKQLIEFKGLVERYFAHSNLNMLTGAHDEKPEAREARSAINGQLNEVYKTIRLAEINPSALYTPHIASGKQGSNMDLILNIFNLERNRIPTDSAVDFIEQAIDVYKADRMYSLIRTINPFFWVSKLIKKIK